MDGKILSVLDTLLPPDFPTAYVALTAAAWALALGWLMLSRPSADAFPAAEETAEEAARLAKASGPISPAGLAVMGRYRYKSSEYTWVDNKMNTYWVWAASLVPRSVAPNLVTLAGTSPRSLSARGRTAAHASSNPLLSSLSPYSLLFCVAPACAHPRSFSCLHLGLALLAAPALYALWLSPEISAPRPWWLHLWASLSFFAYQTFDAVDGKHARATGASSPLGQLFDHGCDAVSVTFIALIMSTSLRVSAPGLFAVAAAILLPFWAAQWGERHTHVLRTSAAGIGLTETQLAAMSLPFLSACVSADFWHTPLLEALAALVGPVAAAAAAATAPTSLLPLLRAATLNHVVLVAYVATATCATVGSVASTVAYLARHQRLNGQRELQMQQGGAAVPSAEPFSTTSEANAAAADTEAVPVAAGLAETVPVLLLSALALAWIYAPAVSAMSASALAGSASPLEAALARTAAAASGPLLQSPPVLAVLGILTLACYCTRLSCEMVVAAMTRDGYPSMPPSLLPLMIHVVALHTPALAPARAATLVVAVAGAPLALLPWVFAVTRQIARALNIRVLTLGRRPTQAEVDAKTAAAATATR
jgi:phosphatidylglycerophosphate synthase